MPGHKTTHTQMERFRLIDSQFSSGRIVPFDEILQFLRSELREGRLSESSVRRDFRYMRDELGAPIYYDPKNHGWKYTKPFKFPSDSFSDDELLALNLIQRILTQHSPEDVISKSMISLVQKITPKMNSEEKLKNDKSAEEPKLFTEAENVPVVSMLSERFFVPPRPKSLIDEEISEKIIFALKNNFMLDFNYFSKWEPEEKHRKIQPYQVILDDGSLYLYGASHKEPENPRLFNVSRMHNVEVIKSEPFKLPPNFRFAEDFEKGRFGAFQYDEWYEFKIAFFGEARRAAREWIWADEQQIEENHEEGKTTVTFTSSQWIPIERWVLSFGAEAKPLAPDWFVADWKASVQKMAETAKNLTDTGETK